MAQQGDNFLGSKKEGTLAVEVECVFLRPDTMVPIGVGNDELTGDDIIKFIKDRGLVDADREWRKDTVEVRPNGYWENAEEAKVGIFTLFEELLNAARHFNLLAIPIAEQPSPRADIYPTAAYNNIYNRYPSVREGANFFGFHIHYGITALDKGVMRAIRRLNGVCGFLTGLLANSPCFPSDVESRRMIAFPAVPGVTFYNWNSPEDYERFMNECLTNGAIERRSRLWAINRPSVYTLEGRFFDATGLVREAWAATGIFSALVSLFLEGEPQSFSELPHLACRRNLEICAGHGLRDLSQSVWNPWRAAHSPLKEAYNDLFVFVKERMIHLGWGEEFSFLEEVVASRNNGASRIRRWVAEGINPRREAFKLLSEEVASLRPEMEKLFRKSSQLRLLVG